LAMLPSRHRVPPATQIHSIKSGHIKDTAQDPPS
jgi:hypothetical protein